MSSSASSTSSRTFASASATGGEIDRDASGTEPLPTCASLPCRLPPGGGVGAALKKPRDPGGGEEVGRAFKTRSGPGRRVVELGTLRRAGRPLVLAGEAFPVGEREHVRC